jgi:hypothetical protein
MEALEEPALDIEELNGALFVELTPKRSSPASTTHE